MTLSRLSCRMLFSSILFLFCVTGSQAGYKENEYIRKLQDARKEVQRYKQEVYKRQRTRDEKYRALVKANNEVKFRAKIRKLNDIRWDMARDYKPRRIKRLEDTLTRLRIDLKYAKPHEKRAIELNMKIIQRQLDKEKAKARIEERIKFAEQEYKKANEAYWQARKAEIKPSNDFWWAQHKLEYAKEQLQKAQNKLAELRLNAARELQKLSPPFLVKVQVAGKGKPVYEARWLSRTIKKKKEIDAAIAAIREQAGILRDFRKTRDDLLKMLIDANDRWQALNEQYITQVKREAWGRIGLDLLDATLSVLWSKKGNWMVNLFTEAAYQGGKFALWYMGKTDPIFSVPKIEEDPETGNPRVKAATAWEKGKKFGIKLGISMLKSSFKSSIQGMIDNKGQIKAAYKEYKFWTVLQAGLNRRMGLQGSSMSAGALRHTQRTLEFASKTRAKYLKEMFGSVWNKKFAGSLAKSFGKNLIKKLGKEAALSALKSKRIEIYLKQYQVNKEYLGILAALQSASRQLQLEQKKLKALQEVRDDLLNELDNVRNQREKIIPVNLAAKSGKITIRLHFTRPVVSVTGTLDKKTLSFSGKDQDWSAQISTKGMPDLASLTVNAKDRDSTKELDGKPDTSALFHSRNARWEGYEKTPDRNHKIKIKEVPEKPLGDGTSIVFLFDLSGSMDKKIAAARQAAIRILNNRKIIGADDEVALWVFRGGTPRMLKGFTKDHKSIAGIISKLSTSGGTPLARSIRQSGEYLLRNAANKRRILAVLSDGKETAGGNPEFEISRIRRLGAITKKWRGR